MSDNLPPLLDFHTYCLLPCISSHPISPSISLASNRHAPSECWANKPGGTGGGGLGMLERSVFPKAFSGLSKRSRRVKNGSGMSSFVGQFGCTPRVGASIPEWARVTPPKWTCSIPTKIIRIILVHLSFRKWIWGYWNSMGILESIHGSSDTQMNKFITPPSKTKKPFGPWPCHFDENRHIHSNNCERVVCGLAPMLV